MKRFFKSIAFRIGAGVFAILLIVFSFPAGILIGNFQKQVENEIIGELAGITQLASSGVLGLDELANPELIRDFSGLELAGFQFFENKETATQSLKSAGILTDLSAEEDVLPNKSEMAGSGISYERLKENGSSYLNVSLPQSGEHGNNVVYYFFSVITDEVQKEVSQKALYLGALLIFSSLVLSGLIVLYLEFFLLKDLRGILAVLRKSLAGDTDIRFEKPFGEDLVEKLKCNLSALLERFSTNQTELGLALHKQAEILGKYNEQQDNLQMALSGGVLGLWEVDVINQKVNLSEDSLQSLGFSKEELCSSLENLQEMINPKDLQEILNLFHAHLMNKTDGFEGNLQVRVKDGSWRFFFIHGRIAEWSENKNPVRVNGTLMDVTGQRRTEILQNTIGKISDVLNSSHSLDELYPNVHRIISELIPAENFYISIYDKTQNVISFPYYIDHHDESEPFDFKLDESHYSGTSLTEYLIQSGRTCLFFRKDIEDLMEKGEISLYGKMPLAWLGVPLRTMDDGVIGVMVTQTYTENCLFDNAAKDLLTFVSSQIAHAIQHIRSDEKLQESESRFRSIFEQSYDGICLVNEEGKIIGWNRVVEHITGFTYQDIFNKSIWEVLGLCLPSDNGHKELPEMLKQHYKNPRKGFGLSSDWFNRPYEMTLINKNYQPVPIQQVNFPIKTSRGFMMGIIMRDISEQKRSSELIQRQLQHLGALRAIDMAITSSFEVDVILDTLLEQVIQQLNVDAAAILKFNFDSQLLEYAGGRGFTTEALRYTRLEMGEGYAGEAADSRRMIFIRDLGENLSELKRSPLLEKENFISYFGLPLIAKDRLEGVLEIYSRSALDPDQDWLDFLQALTGQAAIAVNNASLFQQQQRSNKELQMAYDFTLDGWAHALELRDLETEGHARRVSNLTVELARLMGLPEKDLVHLRRGAILHDIGKMGIPDSILFKPGSLTDEEWRIMRQHPLYGYEMLKPIEFLKPALSVVRSHHEKWNGGGYPDGLAGEAIPLFARIFAVADVWDSLTHARPYKAAWPKEDSKKFIVSQSGIHFDPQVVEVFLDVIEKDEYQLEGSFPNLKEPMFQIGND